MAPRDGRAARVAVLATAIMAFTRSSAGKKVLTALPVSAMNMVKRPAGKGVMGDITQQLDQGLNYSILDSLKTGNMMVDMLVCMLVPVAIRFLLVGDFTSILGRWNLPFTNIFSSRRYVRVIEYIDGGNTRMRYNPSLEDAHTAIENTDRNNILQKAIRLYMCSYYDIDDSEMETNLVSTKKIKLEEKNDQYGRRQVFGGSYTQLLAFAVHNLPQRGKWTLVDKEKCIWFMQTVNEQQVGSEVNPQLMTKTIMNVGGKTAAEVNKWISDAFDYYREQRKNDQDTSRFFFVATTETKPAGGGAGKSDGSAGKVLFKQYLLSDHKTFGSLFFPEKDSLLALIDQFLKKQGKFAIEGFPNKLGLLLDGPPGTGKTSLIKALAHYCNRHVVSVNLAKIKTNQGLMDLLFDLVFPVQGGDLPAKLKFEDIIFVMEDVDAASKVVYARADTKKKKLSKKKKAKAKKQAKAVMDGASESTTVKAGSDEAKGEPSASATEGEKTAEANTETNVDKDSESTSSGKAPPPQMPQLLRMISARSARDEDEEEKGKEEKEEEEEDDDDDEDDDEDEEHDKSKGDASLVKEIIGAMMYDRDRDHSGNEKEGSGSALVGPPWKKSFYEGEDDLNLAGLLNVLDGVVDSPGRIVVMTTNHPDKLDPALIRPGRINKRIHLGFCNGKSVCAMAEHYMQVKLTPTDREKLESLASKTTVTPAQVEQCCAESEDVAELIGHLAELR